MYEITVKTDVTVTVPAGKEYSNTHKKDESGEDIWDYIPRPPYEKVESRTIYQQQVESINVLKLVAAINGVDW